jgi:pyruvate formate lyase activating enzyme
MATDKKGLVFDIEEFGIYDGPGIRTVVFLKGCPLRCMWCQNPEGWHNYPERMVSSRCIHCGTCKRVCPHPDKCVACGTCLPYCPVNAISIAGEYLTSSELAEKILANAQLLKLNGGGVTFTGGECLTQTPFVLEVRNKLQGIHCAIETSGYADSQTFTAMIKAMDLVMFDIKQTDPVIHRKYIGEDNIQIHENLRILMQSGVPFIIRIPLIPGVNDTDENFRMTAEWIKDAKNLMYVEMLPYNRSAGAKYKMLGLEYKPTFDEKAEPKINTAFFEKYGIKVKVM